MITSGPNFLILLNYCSHIVHIVHLFFKFTFWQQRKFKSFLDFYEKIACVADIMGHIWMWKEEQMTYIPGDLKMNILYLCYSKGDLELTLSQI